jgi:hypothetical protein
VLTLKEIVIMAVIGRSGAGASIATNIEVAPDWTLTIRPLAVSQDLTPVAVSIDGRIAMDGIVLSMENNDARAGNEALRNFYKLGLWLARSLDDFQVTVALPGGKWTGRLGDLFDVLYVAALAAIDPKLAAEQLADSGQLTQSLATKGAQASAIAGE